MVDETIRDLVIPFLVSGENSGTNFARPGPLPTPRWKSMSFGRYRLLSQLGAGRDGVRYRAVDRNDGSAVEIVLLAEARANPARWQVIGRRLRVALMIAHPSSRRVVGLDMDCDPPFVALEWVDGPTLADLGREEPEATARTIELALALAAGHRVGLALGTVAPGLIRSRTQNAGDLVLDWFGLDVDSLRQGRPTDLLDASCRAPELSRGSSPTRPPISTRLARSSTGGWAAWRLPRSTRIAGRPAPPRDARRRPHRPAVGQGRGRAFDEGRRHEPFDAGRGVGPRRGHVGDDRLRGRGVQPRTTASPSTEIAWAGSGWSRRWGRGGWARSIGVKTSPMARPSRSRCSSPPSPAVPESLKRFHKEARLLAEVNNPRVANFIELNEDDGIHFIALEYVAGTNLADWIVGRGPIDERTSLAILADVARALESAHERGIVHRDIKPENILVMRDPAEALGLGRPELPRVKLSDFGLARHVVESESLILTRDGAIIGTPLYMSPEQCAGESQIGPGADVYAMGATLFTLLAGRPPFTGDAPLIVMAKHRTEPPPDLKALVPSVSDAAGSIVAKAMAKLPEHRYANAREFLLDLERLLRGEPTGLELHPRLPGVRPQRRGQPSTGDGTWSRRREPSGRWSRTPSGSTGRLAFPRVQFERRGRAGGRLEEVRPVPQGGGRIHLAGAPVRVDRGAADGGGPRVRPRAVRVVRERGRAVAASREAARTCRIRSGSSPAGILGRTIAAVEIGTRGRQSRSTGSTDGSTRP